MSSVSKKHLSGCEKRKKQKENQEKISKLPKIFNFFSSISSADSEKSKYCSVITNIYLEYKHIYKY